MGQVKYHFNDERLNSRAEMCFSEVLQNPLKDFPEVFKKSADLEGFYRLLNNSEVFLDELQKTIVEDTQARIFASNLQKRDILVLHDTTEICPPKANSIPAFKKDGKFFTHLSLLTEIHPSQHIYGVGDITMWPRSRGYKSELIDDSKDDNEENRWWDQIAHINSLWPMHHLIHVMDQEADACKIWSNLQETQCRFVIRLHHNRNVLLEDGTPSKLLEVIKDAPLKARLTITLNERKLAEKAPPRSKKRHPNRRTREARLQVRASKVDICKTSQFHRNQDLGSVKINILHVFEDNKRKDKVDWLIMTSEPIESEQDCLRLIHIYQSRWLVEEFFKGLKTGCRLEKRLFADEGAWYRLLLFLLPVVTKILNLRWLANQSKDPKLKELSEIQWKILSLNAHQNHREIENQNQAYAEIAHLGGHIKSNGPPGWMVLLRGFVELLNLEKGWKLAQIKM